MASRVGFGWDGKQEPRAQEDGEERREPRLCGEARLAPPSTPAAAVEQPVIPRLAAVKTETESALVDHRGRDIQAPGSPLLNSGAASTSQGSETAGGVTTPPFVKNDTIPGGSMHTSPACDVGACYKHQLFSACKSCACRRFCTGAKVVDCRAIFVFQTLVSSPALPSPNPTCLADVGSLEVGFYRV